MDIIKDLLKGANPIIILLLAFLIWQVVNHIPTDIKEVKKEVKEVRQEIKEVRQEIKETRKELSDKMDKILFYLIDGDKAKLKEGIKEK